MTTPSQTPPQFDAHSAAHTVAHMLTNKNNGANNGATSTVQYRTPSYLAARAETRPSVEIRVSPRHWCYINDDVISTGKRAIAWRVLTEHGDTRANVSDLRTTAEGVIDLTSISLKAVTDILHHVITDVVANAR